MIEAQQETWPSENQADLVTALEHLHDSLMMALESGGHASGWIGWPALEALVERFELGGFERQVVILATAVELDGRIPALLGQIGGTQHATGPSASTLFRLCREAHWAALAPQAPLRLLQVIESDDAPGFAERPYRLAERVLHFLLGVPALDTRLGPVLIPLVGEGADVAAFTEEAETLLRLIGQDGQVQLTGADSATRRAMAERLAELSDRPPYLLSQADLPQTSAEREAFVQLWTREVFLSGALLVIDVADPEPSPAGALSSLARRLPPGVIFLLSDPMPGHVLDVPRLDMPQLSMRQRRETWQQLLGNDETGLPDRLAAQFKLPLEAMQSSARAAEDVPKDVTADQQALADARARSVWATARAHARPGLAKLAQRVDVRRGWDDIVLPDAKMATLRALTAQTSMRSRVYEDWGFGEKLSSRGLGITALFAGPSGTGKTLAAEVIAGALDLDLYTIDLSSVVSKYIGETEKNLGRIFDAAEAGGVVLLFDEADALFGKRSEVKDSHDRYANIEVGYLLQRMESYSGLAILTTNLKGNMDGAFLRRLRFVVDFPFPGYDDRLEIWRRAFPSAAPLGEVQPKRLAQLNVSGGAIRNISLNAAFLAAQRGGAIEMSDLMDAARAEYAKLEKPLTDSETRGWRLPK